MYLVPRSLFLCLFSRSLLASLCFRSSVFSYSNRNLQHCCEAIFSKSFRSLFWVSFHMNLFSRSLFIKKNSRSLLPSLRLKSVVFILDAAVHRIPARLLFPRFYCMSLSSVSFHISLCFWSLCICLFCMPFLTSLRCCVFFLCWCRVMQHFHEDVFSKICCRRAPRRRTGVGVYVFVCVCVCRQVYMCRCLYMYVYVYVYIVYIYMYICTYISICTYAYTYIYVYIYICI